MNTKEVVLIVLAVLGGLVSLSALGMWLTHSMMGGGMMGSMHNWGFGGLPMLLGTAVLVVAIILLLRSRIK